MTLLDAYLETPECDVNDGAENEWTPQDRIWLANPRRDLAGSPVFPLATIWRTDQPEMAGACGLFVDLGPYLDGTAHQEIPTVAEVWPEFCLFYSGRLNELHAEPGVGKTNILMAACISVLDDGGTVLYIDPEDTPGGFATRMRLLGADPQDIRTRVFYLHNPDPAAIKAAQAWAREHSPTIVVLDGLAESMAAVNANEDKSQDVLPFFRETLRPFAEGGAAVAIADHVPKSRDKHSQFARGSGAKAGRYDGVSYSVECGTQYAPGQAGFVKLRVAKDRNGGVGPRGKVVAELHFNPSGPGTTAIEFRPPQGTGPFRPTAIMDKIRQRLAGDRTATKRELRAVGGKARYVDLAIDLLMQGGELVMTPQGTSHVYSLAEIPQPA